MTYTYIVFRYYELAPKKKPKFQYWNSETEDQISDWSNFENKDKLGLKKQEYIKTYKTAKTIIDTDNVDKIKNKMSKYFTEFSIKHSELINIEDITNFSNPALPNFKGHVKI